MVDIVRSDQPSSVTLNIDTGEISPVFNLNDSLVRLADDVGIVETINDINEESFHTDHELRDQYGVDNEPVYTQESDEDENYQDDQQHEEEQDVLYQDQHPEQRPKKKQARKSRGDKRYNDLIGKLSEQALEKEEIIRQRDDNARELKRLRDEQTAMMLNLEKQKIASDIERVTNVMVRAKETDQTRVYVEGNKVMSDLMMQDAQIDSTINQFNKIQEEEYGEPQVSEYEALAEQKFLDLSDTKEIKSAAYSEWLRDNSYYNPYDIENYDEDLAQDVHSIKKDFNKFLKHNRNGSFIGTPEYYQELDGIVQHKLYGDFVPQKKSYSNRGYANQREDRDMTRQYNVPIDPYYEESLGSPMQEGQKRMRGMYPDDPGYQSPQNAYRPPAREEQGYQGQRRPNVMPVSRNGYNQQYSNNVPQLDDRERKIAIMMPMFDTQGRQLSEREKIQQYAAGKADMMNKNRR